MPELLSQEGMCRTIIAGGRDYHLTKEDRAFLDTLPICEVVSGGAPGADSGGEAWAALREVPVRRFPANWAKYGKAAGPMRNQEMADYAEAVVLFPGGAGTADMRRRAKSSGLIFWEPRR